MRRFIDIMNEQAGFVGPEDDWRDFYAFTQHQQIGPNEVLVFRGTTNVEGQYRSDNYLATYFSTSLSYVQNYSYIDGNTMGYVGAYRLTHEDKFLDLRYGYEEGEIADPDEWHKEREFSIQQHEKLLALAQRYYHKVNPLSSEVYAMLENPPAEFIGMVRQDGYFGLITSEGDFSYRTYAVFNEHLGDCVEHLPFGG